MTIDYKMVNGTQVAVICDIENADLTKDEWKKFGNGELFKRRMGVLWQLFPW